MPVRCGITVVSFTVKCLSSWSASAPGDWLACACSEKGRFGRSTTATLTMRVYVCVSGVESFDTLNVLAPDRIALRSAMPDVP